MAQLSLLHLPAEVNEDILIRALGDTKRDYTTFRALCGLNMDDVYRKAALCDIESDYHAAPIRLKAASLLNHVRDCRNVCQLSSEVARSAALVDKYCSLPDEHASLLAVCTAHLFLRRTNWPPQPDRSCAARTPLSTPPQSPPPALADRARVDMHTVATFAYLGDVDNVDRVLTMRHQSQEWHPMISAGVSAFLAMVACARGHTTVADMILSNPNPMSQLVILHIPGLVPIVLPRARAQAARYGHVETVQRLTALVQHQVSRARAGGHYVTLLSLGTKTRLSRRVANEHAATYGAAAAAGHPAVIDFLRNPAASGHAVLCPWLPGHERDVLHTAAQHGRTALVRVALAHGAGRAHHGLWPFLRAAAAHGHARTVEVLLLLQARPFDGHAAAYALHEAVRRGHADVVRVLLGSGFDFGLLDPFGSSWLALAARLGRAGVVRVLLEADVGREDWLVESVGQDVWLREWEEVVDEVELLGD